MTDFLVVIGTRPQTVKLASLTREMNRVSLDYEIVHTGQHQDFEMSDLIMRELKIRKPLFELGIEGGNASSQTGRMMIALQEVYSKVRPKMVVVPGDTNSALAAGLSSVKSGVKMAHLEAGLRSGDIFMQEEINRRVLDTVGQALFAPTEVASSNLKSENLGGNTFLTGDVMADNISYFKKQIRTAQLPAVARSKKYVYVTLHRFETIGNSRRLKEISKTLAEVPRVHDLEVIFPVHPHTHSMLAQAGLLEELERSVKIVKPVGYFTSIRLAKEARIVLTDSGGLQKEAFLVGTPIVTLRETTEWVETVRCGYNILAGWRRAKIHSAIAKFSQFEGKMTNRMRLYGGGHASERVIRILKKFSRR